MESKNEALYFYGEEWYPHHRSPEDIGVDRVVDDAAADNVGAIALMTKAGLRVIEETEEITLLGMTKAEYVAFYKEEVD